MKKLLISTCCLFFIFTSQGPLTSATTTDDASIGNITWANPNNSQTENGVSAVVSFIGFEGTISHALTSTNYGFTVPVGSTINGILYEWKASSVSGGEFFAVNSAQAIIKGGVLSNAPDGGINASDLTGTLTFYSAGSATDLWGNTWTVSDINASGFGAYLQIGDVNEFVGSTAAVDVVRLTVFYTTAAGKKKQVIGYGGGIMETRDMQ